MTTADPFTEAAREEFYRVWHSPIHDHSEIGMAIHMAEWARSYLREQEPTDADEEIDLAEDHFAYREGMASEPTDAEVEAVAKEVHKIFPRYYVDEFGFTCKARWDELEPHMRDEYRAIARFALSAGRHTRQEPTR